MKNWYRAVCDTHKETMTFFVNNPRMTEWYLGEKSEEINAWLSTHYGCELRMVWRDDQLDPLWEEYNVDRMAKTQASKINKDG